MADENNTTDENKGGYHTDRPAVLVTRDDLIRYMSVPRDDDSDDNQPYNWPRTIDIDLGIREVLEEDELGLGRMSFEDIQWQLFLIADSQILKGETAGLYDEAWAKELDDVMMQNSRDRAIYEKVMGLMGQEKCTWFIAETIASRHSGFIRKELATISPNYPFTVNVALPSDLDNMYIEAMISFWNSGDYQVPKDMPIPPLSYPATPPPPTEPEYPEAAAMFHINLLRVARILDEPYLHRFILRKIRNLLCNIQAQKPNDWKTWFVYAKHACPSISRAAHAHPSGNILEFRHSAEFKYLTSFEKEAEVRRMLVAIVARNEPRWKMEDPEYMRTLFQAMLSMGEIHTARKLTQAWDQMRARQ